VRLPATTATIVAAFIIAAGGPARADDANRVRALSYDTATDLVVTSMGALWLVASELYKADLAPETCRWCYRTADGTDALNPYDGWVRRQLVWRETRGADVASSVVAFAVTPAAGFGLTAAAAAHDGAIRGAPADALVITEATVIAASVNQIAKFAFGRERPFVHFLPREPNGSHAATDNPADDNLSFFSGHTTLAFALATSSGTVATMRNYRLAPVVWGAGLTAATTAGYLRIAADKHYLTDVITGVVVGSLIGAAVPLVFHSPAAEPAASSVNGAATVAPAAVMPWSIGGAF